MLAAASSVSLMSAEQEIGCKVISSFEGRRLERGAIGARAARRCSYHSAAKQPEMFGSGIFSRQVFRRMAR